MANSTTLNRIDAEDSTLKDEVLIQCHRIPILFREHPTARRYVLRLRADAVLVTVPRRGTLKFARAFVKSRQSWLEAQWQQLQAIPTSKSWGEGTELFFRGEYLPLRGEGGGPWARLGAETIRVGSGDWRPAVERHLKRLAVKELPPRLAALATLHGLRVNRITVRNQRRRWGSCSRQGNISLNWRLVQLPHSVSDYILLHELMHLRQMNHSARFWAEVAKVCPGWEEAEGWLKSHSALVGL